MKNKFIIYLNLIKYRIIHIFKYVWLVIIKLNWNKLYIRKNEFHSSLDLDGEAMSHMNDKEREKYILDLVKRRNIAHYRDLNN